MIPDSPLFLYGFLPAVLALFYLSPVGLRCGVLLAASAAYCFLADAAGLPVLAGAILGNYLFGRLIGAAQGAARRRCVAAGVAANIALLAIYKYATATAPLGVSFFTFSAAASSPAVIIQSADKATGLFHCSMLVSVFIEE